MKNIKILLISIIVLAALLRFWELASNPPSLYWDEVSQGYNTYSILTTGRDEHGEFLPIARFKAFGDYKAPVYIYADVPFMALFGKSEFAVRFPSAFFGTLTVLITYLLVKQLFHDNKREHIALLSALFLAISPWHIQLSRVAYEGNIATFFTVLGLYLLLVAINKYPWMLLGSAVSFVIGFYAFNAHRVFIPLFLLLLAVVCFKDLKNIRSQTVVAAVLGIVLLLPFLIFFQAPESKLRFQEVNIFSDLQIIEESNKQIEQEGDRIAKLLHNRRVLYVREYIINYFDFFHPKYLFFTGDVNPRFSHQENGQLYLWILPLLLLGLYSLITGKRRIAYIIIGWFLLAPLAAATARETPHALRSATYIPTYEIIAAAGFVHLLSLFKNRVIRTGIASYCILIAIISFSLLHFWHNYSFHNPRLYSTDWQYGYKETIAITERIKNNYDEIYFTNAYGRPSIYVAWYGDVHPSNYLRFANVERDIFGFYNVRKLGKYTFVDRIPDARRRKALIVTTREDLPQGVRVLEIVRFLNGKEAFVIAE